MTPDLTAALLQLGLDGSSAVAAYLAVFLRVGAAAALLPAFGDQMVPMRIRLAVTVALAFVVAPAVLPQVEVARAAGGADWRFLLTEVMAGLLFGLTFRLMIHALQVAGTIAAQSVSLAQFFGGGGVDPQPAISQLLMIAGLGLFMATGLHLEVIAALVASYELLPPGRLMPAADAALWSVAGVARAFALAFTIAAPLVGAALIYNIVLGVINRAMPQLMVTFIGAPALTLGGIAMLVLAVPAGLSLWVITMRDIAAGMIP